MGKDTAVVGIVVLTAAIDGSREAEVAAMALLAMRDAVTTNAEAEGKVEIEFETIGEEVQLSFIGAVMALEMVVGLDKGVVSAPTIA